MKKLIDSFTWAFEGIIYNFKSQRNFRIHSFFALAVVAFGIILKVSITEFAVLLLCIALVMSLECVNTAIENTVDLLTDEHKDKAKFAKDSAAGAVLIAAIFCAITGSMIFINRLMELL